MFANMNEWLPVAILLVPLFTALTIFLIPEKKEGFRTSVNLLSAALNIGLIVVLINGVYQGQVFEARMPLLPDINLVFHADALSLMFVTLSGVLWFFTTLYAIGYFAHGKQRSRFFGFFSLCVFSTIGIALAGNLITFLIFYELLTLATYPLIMHKGNDASLRSGKIYLAYTMIGGAVLLIGVVWLKSFAGSLEFSNTYDLMALAEGDTQLLTIILVMLLLGLGVKAAIFPLHGWLPRAMAAPAPVSSLLHAVAVVKAGAFGIIRVVYDVYGIDLVAKLNMLNVLLVFAAFTILYGSVRAVFQSDIKKRLAYSTVSQVSYIALGIAVAGPFAALGAIVHLVHQGLMKITMFFCAGNLAESHHIYRVDQLNGIGKKMPYTMSAFTIAIFGMIGMPPIAGFVSKWYLGLGGLQSDLIWVQGVLIGSSILNAMYFLPIVYRAWFLPASDSKQGANLEESEHSSQSDGAYHIQIKEAPWSMLLPPIVTVSIAIMAGLFASSAYSPLAWAKHITSSRGLELSEMASYNTVHTANHGNFWMLLVVICLPVLMLAVARVVKLPKLLSLSLPS
jgi:multicomponent Na+:H+ antiporter subunit D